MFELKENKIHKMTVRFTDSEKKVIENYMKENNFQSFSDFIRYLIVNEVRK